MLVIHEANSAIISNGMADYRSRLAASVDRYDHVGSQSSPEDEANCRSQQERVGAFMPLSDRSLVVLAS